MLLILAGDNHALIGYVVFTSTKGIPAALKLNGHFVVKDNGDAGRHIRVDICGQRKPTYNTQKCIFIGNLPFSASEEEVCLSFFSAFSLKKIDINSFLYHVISILRLLLIVLGSSAVSAIWCH